MLRPGFREREMTMHFCITGGAIQNVKLTRLLTQEEVVIVRQKAVHLRSVCDPSGK
jgi:hypothetical protein